MVLTILELCVEQADLELALIRHLSLQSARITGVRQRARQTQNMTQS